MVIMGPMLMLEWVLVLLLAAVVLTNLAERLAVPYPSLLAIAGVGLAFLPFAPQIRIEPELALALFVAPALLDAAFDTSLAAEVVKEVLKTFDRLLSQIAQQNKNVIYVRTQGTLDLRSQWDNE